MPNLSEEQQKKQLLYRDARFTNKYDDIWQTVGKCVFCDLNEKYVFFEENGIVMTITLYAYIDGHFMIVPRRHVKSVKELSDIEWQTIRKFTYIAKKLVKSVHGIKGMQLVQKDGTGAQSTVEHIHFHCVPFDSPDLLTWNYRQLKHTPLENVALYKNARKKIITADIKFQKKYEQSSLHKIVCDLIIVNEDNEILFEERRDEFKFSPDYITLPGGGLNQNAASLEEELHREIEEEISLTLKPGQIQLVNSQLDSITRSVTSTHLSVKYPLEDRHLRNTYILRNFKKDTPLKAGDDAEKLIWVKLKDIADHDLISPSTKAIIKKVLL